MTIIETTFDQCDPGDLIMFVAIDLNKSRKFVIGHKLDENSTPNGENFKHLNIDKLTFTGNYHKVHKIIY